MNNHYKHILICMDLTEIDEHLIKYSAFWAEVMQVRRITFLHVLQAYDITAQTDEEYQELKNTIHSYIDKEINKYLKKRLPEGVAVDIAIRIEEKDASDEIINFVRKHKVDLTIFGKKAEAQRKERYSARSIALAESDMLVVPSDPPQQLNHVLIASDLSKQGVKAFKVTYTLAKNVEAGISCQYIYGVPKQYFPVTSPKAMYQHVRKVADKRMKRLKKHYGYLLNEMDFYLDPGTHGQQDDTIISAAEKTGSHLIVLGARGRTSAPTTLLGNITTRLRRYNSNIPVLILKNSQEKNSFWNTFFHG